MKDRLLHKILFDCHRATLLSIKREEKRLTLREWAALYYHLLHCNLCRNFAVQSRKINKALLAIQKGIGTNPPYRLSDRAKFSIQEKIKGLSPR